MTLTLLLNSCSNLWSGRARRPARCRDRPAQDAVPVAAVDRRDRARHAANASGRQERDAVIRNVVVVLIDVAQRDWWSDLLTLNLIDGATPIAILLDMVAAAMS